eukprot:s673_g15.t1
MHWTLFTDKISRDVSQCHIPHHNTQEHRRMGFGSLLLKTLIAEAKRLPEIHSIGLSSLPGSIKFYKRHGFKLMHRLPDSEAKAEGQVYMELKTPSKKKKYFDPDPGSRDDFKMYTRHMGDDPRQSLLLHSVQDCLGKSGLSKQELRGQNLGFFCGLSGNEMYHELMTGDVKSLGRAAQGLLTLGRNEAELTCDLTVA